MRWVTPLMSCKGVGCRSESSSPVKTCLPPLPNQLPAEDGDVIRRISTCLPPRFARKAKVSTLLRKPRLRRGTDHNRNVVVDRPEAAGDHIPHQAPACSSDNDRKTSEKPVGRRLIMKNGCSNVRKRHISSRGWKFLVDIFTTLVDMAWGTSILLFSGILIASWILFALVWWLVAVRESPSGTTWSWSVSSSSERATSNDVEPEPCVPGVHDFHTALLFSVETQHTIGYGTRSVGSACPGAATVLMAQSCVGILISSLLAGLTYAKLARPVARAKTVIFSRLAVVCRRDGVHCLLFRVGDMRRSHIVNVTIRALLVRWRLSPSGTSLNHYPIKLETETGDDLQMLMWPATVVHRITMNSPLWNWSANQLKTDRYPLEIIVVLQGVVEVSGRMVEIRTSYLSSEIVWGARFKPLMVSAPRNRPFTIDFSQFDEFEKIKMSPLSASAYSRRRQRRSESTSGDSNTVSIEENLTSLPHDDVFGDDDVDRDLSDDDNFSSTFAPVSPATPRADWSSWNATTGGVQSLLTKFSLR